MVGSIDWMSTYCCSIKSSPGDINANIGWNIRIYLSFEKLSQNKLSHTMFYTQACKLSFMIRPGYRLMCSGTITIYCVSRMLVWEFPFGIKNIWNEESKYRGFTGEQVMILKTMWN